MHIRYREEAVNIQMMNVIVQSLGFLAHTLPFMIVGVIFAEFIIALNIVDKISFLARPLTRFAHLSEECGASFMTAFISPTSANAMLAAFYSEGRIEKKELFIASMMTSFPAIVMHWRPMLPVLLPLLGWVGAFYFCMLVIVGLLKTLLIMLAGRILLEEKGIDNREDRDGVREGKRSKDIKIRIKEAIRESLQSSFPVIKRIVLMTVPTTFIVFTLSELGIFDILAQHLWVINAYFPIPAEGLSIVAAHLVSFVASATVASSLLLSGIISAKDVVLTMLVADVISTITVMRWLIPYYIGIFGTRIGTEIMLIATSIRISIMIAIIFLLHLLW